MSGNSYRLDTNILIGLLKGEPGALALLESHPEALETGAVSQITRMELLNFPGLHADEERQIRGLLSQCRVILLDESIEAEAITPPPKDPPAPARRPDRRHRTGA